VAFRNRGTLWARLNALVRDRAALLRLAVCLAALLALLAAVQGWQAPFPFREGDVPAHGLSAKIDFQRVDTERTERARKAAEDQAPLVYRNWPEKLDPLPQQLRAALGQIAQAETLEQLSPEVRRAFGLVTNFDGERPGAERFRPVSPQAGFEALKSALAMADAQSVQQRIDDIIDDFVKFISPLRTLGVIDEHDVRPNFARPDSRLLILSPWEGEDVIEVFTPQVQLSLRLTEAGDLGKAWLSYPGIPAALRQGLAYWLVQSTPPTLLYDDVRSQEQKLAARKRVLEIIDRYNRGDRLVPPGEMIDRTRLDLLAAEYAAIESEITLPERLLRAAIVFVMLLVLAVLTGYYVVSYETRLAKELGRLCVYLGVIVAAVVVGRWLAYWSRAEIVPLVVTVMIFAIAFNQVLATLTGFTLALVLTVSTTMQLEQFIVLLTTAATASVPLARVASRSAMLKVGFYAGVSYFLVSCGVAIIDRQTLAEVWSNQAILAHAAWGAAWCLIAGAIVGQSLPFIESAFGVVTDISLLELSNPSHPLLQELVRRAPGTYNHSIAVASIAETAAEAIGANGLLVRVGAYFHDIGKMLKPQYFIENTQAGAESRHAQLAPAMSTLIIIGHVKDGVDLAQQHHLPRALIDFIEQHHGTTLVEYFYHAATKQAEQWPDHGLEAEESAFRYPGPKPQTPEAGVLMLADAVESASRALTDPTPKRLETLVHDLTMKRLLDGQFEECSLKLSDIHTIERSLVKSLIAIYHGRIRYPDAKASEPARSA
jgi:putative nucleotidyltransferase with HDIG domain